MTDNVYENLRSRVHHAARLLDDRAYQEFAQLFTDNGEYRVQTIAPGLAEPMIWMLMSRDELAARLASESEHEWKITRIPEQTRLVTTDTIEIDGVEATTSASFCLYHTDENGGTQVYAVGRYQDVWLANTQADEKTWLLAKRRVVLKTRLLAMPSPIPI